MQYIFAVSLFQQPLYIKAVSARKPVGNDSNLQCRVQIVSPSIIDALDDVPHSHFLLFAARRDSARLALRKLKRLTEAYPHLNGESTSASLAYATFASPSGSMQTAMSSQPRSLSLYT